MLSSLGVEWGVEVCLMNWEDPNRPDTSYQWRGWGHAKAFDDDPYMPVDTNIGIVARRAPGDPIPKRRPLADPVALVLVPPSDEELDGDLEEGEEVDDDQAGAAEEDEDVEVDEDEDEGADVGLDMDEDIDMDEEEQ